MFFCMLDCFLVAPPAGDVCPCDGDESQARRRGVHIICTRTSSTPDNIITEAAGLPVQLKARDSWQRGASSRKGKRGRDEMGGVNRSALREQRSPRWFPRRWQERPNERREKFRLLSRSSREWHGDPDALKMAPRYIALRALSSSPVWSICCASQFWCLDPVHKYEGHERRSFTGAWRAGPKDLGHMVEPHTGLS